MTGMRVLVTGGAGFIGSAAVLELVEAGHDVVVLDALTYAAAPGTVDLLEATSGCALIRGDIRDPETAAAAVARCDPDAVLHLAAESHVDRSIDDAADFIDTNVTGAFRMLEAARRHRDRLPAKRAEAFRFVHVSTDEVFGALGEEGRFSETTRYDPSSPYSASKAASDHLARAWGRTYGLNVCISNCSNNYGPRQFPEKLIPLMLLNAMEGRPLPVYGDGAHVRDWLHVEDHAKALRLIVERGETGETYCVGGEAERSNLEVVEAVCDIMDRMRPTDRSRRDLITFVADRPGHDRRYAVDPTKIKRALGWAPSRSFEEGLEETARWYLENPAWWAPLRERYDRDRLGLGS